MKRLNSDTCRSTKITKITTNFPKIAEEKAHLYCLNFEVLQVDCWWINLFMHNKPVEKLSEIKAIWNLEATKARNIAKLHI